MSTAGSLLGLLPGLTVLLAPSLGLASAPYSWCKTGEGLTRFGPDQTTNDVIGAVCDTPGYEGCCSSGTDAGRWGLRCVQRAAANAMQLPGVGDYCGRYAWAGGRVAGTQQHFPRDFNLVALSGAVSTLQDVQGPIAAKGDITASYFNMNHGAQEGIAVMGRARVILANGTVHGQVLYGTSYGGGASVTFFDADPPTVFGYPAFPFDFDAASNGLKAASQRIKNIPSLHSIVDHMAVRFDGNDPELNVFDVAGNDLKYATSYQFNVPLGSSIIVNVPGTNVTIQNAGFQGNYSARNLLWNFPDATKLYLRSVGLPGSILAPKAAADFRYGSIRGTVVVASAYPAYVELYSAPYQVPTCKGSLCADPNETPACAGSLCVDPTWSCSDDTLIDADGHAATLKAEAGFLEIAGGDYVAEVSHTPDYSRVSPTNRVWYAFQPAKTMPKNKPLAVMFNGGPGTSTTGVLFSFNTGTYTLDPNRTGGLPLIPNPYSWTEFANLLYIDAPATGFSYPVDDPALTNPDGSRPHMGMDMDHDAGIFLRVVLRFLARHPDLNGNRVVLVGESYGGVRANLMLHYLYDYPSLNDDSAEYRDSQLADELEGYFLRTFFTTQPSAVQIATRFGHQVLIQPALVGDFQQEFRYLNHERLASRCMNGDPDCWRWDQETCDQLNCDKPPQWQNGYTMTALERLADVQTLSTALGVDVTTIGWMYSSQRTAAYGRWYPENPDLVEKVLDPIGLEQVFGSLLSPDDTYLVKLNHSMRVSWCWGVSRDWDDPDVGVSEEHGSAFLNSLLNVSTFITDAAFDPVIYTPSIVLALEKLRMEDPNVDSLVDGFIIDDGWSDLIPDRPGRVSVIYKDGSIRDILTPHMYESGHSVTIRAPAELFADVREWYQDTLQ